MWKWCTMRSGHTSKSPPLHTTLFKINQRNTANIIHLPTHLGIFKNTIKFQIGSKNNQNQNFKKTIWVFERTWNPFPVVIPAMSTYWPGWKWRTVSSVPTGRIASSVTGNSAKCCFNGTPAALKWPNSGLVNCFALRCPAPICNPATTTKT